MGSVSPYITEAMSRKDGKVRPYRALVFSPSIMVEKWKREIKERVPNCEVYEITHWTDVLKLKDKPYRPEKIEYYVMNADLPKYTYPMEPIKDWRYSKDEAKAQLALRREEIAKDGSSSRPKPKIRLNKKEVLNVYSGNVTTSLKTSETGFHCPRCGGLLHAQKDKPADKHFFEQRAGGKWHNRIKKDINYVCKNMIKTKYLPKEEVKDPKAEEQRCGFVLWQPEKLPMDSKKRKLSPAWAINKFLRRGFFKYLIADEVHEYKSGDSATAQAFGQLINHTEKQILLTGTLMGGMASDIFYLLARLDPKRLLKEGITYRDEALFTNRYGVVEKKYRRTQTGRRSQGVNKKPGISPHLFPLYLMPNCVFLELSDLGYALPPYQEIPVVVPMNDEHRAAYDSLEREIGSIMRQNSYLGGMRFVSTYVNSMYQYADAPFNVKQITAEDENGNSMVIARPINFDEDKFESNKFKRLLNILDDEIYQQKRKVLIYVKYTGKNAFTPMDTYLYDRLKDLGYKVGILRSSGSYDGIKMPKSSKDREQWFKDQMEANDWDIVITNPKLVKVGLDLLQFPTIVYYQMDYSTYDYMQSSRRSWRIKQTQPVRVYTLVYENTIQSDVLEHIAKKIDAAMAMQGKFSEEGLRAMADNDDGLSFNSLAKKLLEEGKLDNIDTIHERFQRLNQSYEEMQNAKYEDYEYYEINPIEGGLETVKKIAQGLIKEMENKISSGTTSVDELVEYMERFDEMMKIVEDAKTYNKGLKKKEQIVEGQLVLDIF